MPFWCRNSNYNLLLVRERLILPPGLFLNVATTVFSVYNLSRNRHHLARTLSKREAPFSGIPTLHRHLVFEIAFSPRTLVAAGGQVGGPGLCWSRGCEQHLLERRLNHSTRGREGGCWKTCSHKSEGLRWDQEGEFPEGQPKQSQLEHRAAWTTLPPWSVCLGRSLCLHLIICDTLSQMTYQVILVRTVVLYFIDRTC